MKIFNFTQIRRPLAAGFMVVLVFLLSATSAWANQKVVCASYPVWLFTRYLTQGREFFEVELLISPATGCPHDFAPRPSDLERLSQAQVLVKNGLGLETYLDRAVKVASPKIVIVDASFQLPTLISSYGRMDLGEGGEVRFGGESLMSPNPHVFMSPNLAGIMVDNIARGLTSADPNGGAHYQAMAARFHEEIAPLEEAIAYFASTRRGYKVITSHGFMDYLAQNLGLAVLADVNPESEVPPSAARLRLLTSFVKDEQVSAILVDPEADLDLAKTLGRETGVVVAVIDPATSGNDNPPRDYYQKVLKEDLSVIFKLFPENVTGSIDLPTEQPAP